METIIKNVEAWAEERGLIKEENSLSQLAKTLEELGEVASAIIKKKPIELSDSIGDVTVCLIILAKQNGMSLESCLIHAYNEIKDRKGATVNGSFIKESDLNQ